MALPPTPVPPPGAAAPPPGMAAPMGDAAPEAPAADEVVCTITRSADGGYTVYAGDEPEEAGEPPEPGEGAAPGEEPAAPEGTPADSVGAALKATMKVLQDDESQAGGDQFQAGFNGGAEPEPGPPA